MILPIEKRVGLIEMNDNCKRSERKGIIWLKAWIGK
jgi:hypothetical protein